MNDKNNIIKFAATSMFVLDTLVIFMVVVTDK